MKKTIIAIIIIILLVVAGVLIFGSNGERAAQQQKQDEAMTSAKPEEKTVEDVVAQITTPEIDVNLAPLDEFEIPDIGATVPDLPSDDLMGDINIDTDVGEVDIAF